MYHPRGLGETDDVTYAARRGKNGDVSNEKGGNFTERTLFSLDALDIRSKWSSGLIERWVNVAGSYESGQSWFPVLAPSRHNGTDFWKNPNPYLS